MFHGESLPCKSFVETRAFSSSSRRVSSSQVRNHNKLVVSSSQVGGVWVFHGESRPCRLESSRCFTASLFLAGRLSSLERSPLHAGSRSRRVSSLQVGAV